jgi:hypothetical protein
VLNHQQLHHKFISDQTRFPVATDGKLVLDPFPTEPLDFGIWFENQSREANECTLKIKMRFLAIFSHGAGIPKLKSGLRRVRISENDLLLI